MKPPIWVLWNPPTYRTPAIVVRPKSRWNRVKRLRSYIRLYWVGAFGPPLPKKSHWGYWG